MFTADVKLDGRWGIAGAEEDDAADVGCVVDCVELAVDTLVEVARAYSTYISKMFVVDMKDGHQPVFVPVIPPRSHGLGGDTAAMIPSYTPHHCL